MKKAVLVISFGTSYPQTCRRTIKAIEDAMADAFPGFHIKRAFTSQWIIDKLKKRDGVAIDNVSQALQKLLDEGYQTVICQPTHIMNGYEYDKLMTAIAPYKQQFKTLAAGRPLLSKADDYEALIDALLESLPPLSPEEALVLMGHGTSHFADAVYSALAHHLALNGQHKLLVGTVEGFPQLADVLKQLEELRPKKVFLAPLMVVAGDHALNDMAGDEEDSWITVLTQKGYAVHPLLKGLGEYPAVRQLYINHAKDALSEI